jgi:two-component system, OmpR family, sensor histidine kinase VicK
MRVKNRRGNDHTYFCMLDMYNLEAFASETASILNQYDLFSERKKLADQRAREVKEMEDFLRTFRHEIRSPIQAVCFAPELIGIILRQENLVARQNFPKRLKEYLSDLKATGNRLEMISKALTLNPDEIVKDFRVYNIFKDCLAPVLAFSSPYAAKKQRFFDIDKDSLLVNMNCDAVALSMAFHGLVDNAIKYSDPGTTIKVFGKPFAGGHEIIVENSSKIFDLIGEDFERITKKSERGKIADQQNLEGSGIGLFLAKRIMELHGGSLELLNRKLPVRFSLKLKG